MSIHTHQQKGTKTDDIPDLINALSPDDTVHFMKWLIEDSKKNALIKKSKPQKSNATDDAVMRRGLGM